MKKSVINNANDDAIKRNIIALLKKSERPLSTQDIAAEIDAHWHSVQMRCLMLQVDGRIQGFKIGRMNLWQHLGGKNE